MAFTTSVRYLSASSGWLAVSASSDRTPATLTLSADPTKASSGTHLAQVLISAGPLGTYVDVFFSVGPSDGKLAASPTSLTFIGQQGVNIVPSQTISVFDRSGATPAFGTFATSSGNWLSAIPGSNGRSITVTAVQAGLPAGAYNGTITIKPTDGSTPTIVPVTLLASGAVVGAALTLSHTAVTLNHQVGTAAPPVQNVGVISTAGFVSFTANTGSATPWLRLTTSANPTPSTSVTGQTPGEFSIVVDPSGLAPGTYVGGVTVTSTGADPRELPVTLTVSSAVAFNANPSALLFHNFEPDSGSGSANVTLSATGSANVPFTATVSPAGAWLSVAPASGSTAAGFQQLTVTANTSGLVPGTYSGSVTVTSQAGLPPFQIPVVLTIAGIEGTRTLVLSRNSVTLNTLTGGTAPSATVDLTSSPVGTSHEFTASASSATGWLSVSPFSGTAPATLTISANPAAVAGPGTYEGSVVVTSLVNGVRETISVQFTLAARAIFAAPASLTFTQTQRGVAPAPQTIQVTANSPSTYTVTVQPSWVRASTSSGSTPSPLTISVDPTGLTPGSHTGNVRITGPSNQVNVPVSLTIPEPPAPTVAPASLTFSYQLGSPAPEPQTVAIGSTGDAIGFAAAATTESGVDWLQLSASSASTPATVTARLNTVSLVPGQHKGTIRITPADPTARPGVVVVTLNVGASAVGVQALLHGAALSPTAVAPGQIITITGAGLGPATGVSASPTAAGAFETRLAGTRVLFDGVPAPLLYVRNDQINAIAPYALQGRFSTRVQVEAGTSFSIPIEARVVDAAPGIFTSGSAGRGQAAALNQDFSINSAANAAARGSIVSIFGTGEGQTDPPGQDGRVIVTDLRKPLLGATATVGGRPAEITYIGSAPSLVSGVFQANIRIPEDVGPGAAPVEIQIGGVATQLGVTIAVR